MLPISICILPDTHLPSCFCSSSPGNSYHCWPLMLKIHVSVQLKWCILDDIWKYICSSIEISVIQWQTQTSLQRLQVGMIKFHSWNIALIFTRCYGMVLSLSFWSFVLLSFPLAWTQHLSTSPLSLTKVLRKDSQSLTSLFSELLFKSKAPETLCLTFWSQEKFGSKKLVYSMDLLTEI